MKKIKLLVFGGEGYIGRIVQNELDKVGYTCFLTTICCTKNIREDI